MKKLLSVILTIIIMAWIIYVPYALSVRLVPFFGLPHKAEGVPWYIVLSIGYYIVNWFAGLTIIAFTAGVLICMFVVGKVLHYLAQDIYRGTLELLEAMEVKK